MFISEIWNLFKGNEINLLNSQCLSNTGFSRARPGELLFGSLHLINCKSLRARTNAHYVFDLVQ